MSKKIKAVGTCICHCNLSPVDLRKYKGKFVAIKNDLSTVVASGSTVSEAFKSALKMTNIDELARTVADENVVSIVKVV